MARVEITVNGRSFQLGCEDGQEDHLRALAERFDAEVAAMADSVGQIGDARLFLMAGLVLCDRLSEGERRADTATGRAAAIVARAAEQVEAMAERLETPS